jgi:YVTN family beta-propeller protein
MQFRILGPLDIRAGSQRLELGARKRRSLLGVLLLHANEAVSADRLIDELWGPHPPTAAPKIVQGHVSALRKLLDPDRILTRPPGYLIDVGDEELDLLQFSRLFQEARDARSERASELLREALALWRGPALADLEFEGFAAREVEQLDELRLTAQIARIEADLALGRAPDLVAELDTLVIRHPLDERLRGQLMLALYRSGRQAAALGVYQQGRRVLVSELGLEPGEELKELERRILAHDDSLGAEPRSRVAIALASPPADRDGRPEIVHAFEPERRVRGWPAAALLPALALAAIAVAATVALVRGGDGAVLGPNSLGLVDPGSNRLVAQTRVGTRPTHVAVSDEAVWVVNSGDRTLTELDPGTVEVRGTTPVARDISSLAAAAGDVWIVVRDSGWSTVDRIDPAFDEPAASRRLGRLVRLNGLRLAGAAAAHGGSLWAGDSYGDVFRLEPATLYAEARVTTSGGTRGLAVTPRAVWAIVGDAAVVRIDPVTAAVVQRFAVATGAAAVAADAAAAWVVSSHEDVVTRIDAATSSVTTVRVGRQPRGVALGFGSVWVANAGDGTVSRIDPKTEAVVATIDLGVSVEGIATGSRGVWVTGFAPLRG